MASPVDALDQERSRYRNVLTCNSQSGSYLEDALVRQLAGVAAGAAADQVPQVHLMKSTLYDVRSRLTEVPLL